MIPQIKPEELKRKLDAGEPVFLLDVRNYDEHSYCHLPGSTLVPLGELAGRLDEVNPPADALTVVYCHHGVRSLTGAAILMQAGHVNVASLSGGIEAWSVRINPSVPRY
ncbi:MAG: rhodanese-like domain-containing protein [Gemmataceae bacterium]